MAIGQLVKAIIYSRTTEGSVQIKEICMPFQLKTSNNELVAELDCRDFNDYLNQLKECIDCYEEISLTLDNDDEITTWRKK